MIPSIILITQQMVYFHFYVLPVWQISLGTTVFSFIFLFWDSDAFDSQLEHFQNWYIRERNIFSVFLSVLTPAQVSMMHNSATLMPGSTFCQKFLVHFLFAFSGVRDQILPDQ
jgi:hypothetical protein